MWKYLLAVATGVVLEYFLDPDRGRRRRHTARDRVFASSRRAGGQLGRKTRYVASNTYGAMQRTAHGLDEPRTLEGVSLANRVKSQVLRDGAIPKSKISIEAVGRVVVLRGVLDDQEQIRVLEEKVAAVIGVQSVENLLHLPYATA